MTSFHSLRARLTFWYALALALVLSVFGGLLYGVVRYQLIRHHDGDLETAAAKVARVLSQQEDCDQLQPAQIAELDRVGRLVLFHEIEGQGRVFYRSRALDAVAAGLEPVLTAGMERSSFDTLPLERRPLRVYSEPYRSRAGRRGVIHVVEPLGDVPAPLASLRFALLVMTPLAVLLSAAVGSWLAARALAPVDEVTRLAREIEADRLGRRLPVPPTDDEIGRLIGTINQMIARLERSFDAMKRFTADASHELRGPLATMRSVIDVALARPRERADYEAFLASLGEDVERLRSVTEDLLVLARADAGRITIARHVVRLDTLAAEIAESLKPAAAAAGVALSAHCDVAVVVQGDEAWLRQLALNLLDNAVKFSGPAAGRRDSASVSISVWSRQGEAFLRVEDSGPGIPPESLARVFERFYRADGARTYQRGQGCGLGLAIAAWIADVHEAKIVATNRAPGGSVFTVTFPEAAASPPDA